MPTRIKRERSARGNVSAWRSPVLHLQVLIVLAVALGGGGVGYGLRNAVIQLAALAICAAHPALIAAFVRRGPRMLVALVMASMALPLIQLIPLPAAIWQALPGRAMMAESLALAGLDPESWQPVSLDRARTLVAFCGTLAPATIIAVGALLEDRAKLQLVLTFVAAALVALLLGTVQISSANTTGLLFPVEAKAGVLYATFANRNSTGLFFVVALALLAALPIPRRREWLLAMVAAGSLLFIGTILTQSRSSLVLLALPIGLIVLRTGFGLWSARGGGKPAVGPAGVLAGAFVLLVAGIALVSITSGGRAGETLERFGTIERDRLTMWEDGQFAIGEYWPLGTGMGTFDEVYQVYESLEYVSQKRAGRMHNGFLEVPLEAGIFGLTMIALWLGWCGWQTLAGKSREDMRWMRLGAGIGIAAIALQCLLDYPLRNQTMLCVAALLVILLARGREQRT